MVHAEMQRRAAEQPCACEHLNEHSNEQSVKTQRMNEFLINPYDGPASESPIGVQESSTLNYNHKLTATANDAILIIGANTSLVIAVYDLLKLATPSAVIYSLEDSNRLKGDMVALNAVIATGRRIKKQCARISVQTDADLFGDKTFTAYRFQGTNLIPEHTYLKDELPDKKATNVAEFTAPNNLDLDVVFVIRAKGSATQPEELNISVTLANESVIAKKMARK